MKIVSVSENKKIEKRISITPEMAQKYIASGFEVILKKSYGEHLGFSDKEYESLGVKLLSDDKTILEEANIILQLIIINVQSRIYCFHLLNNFQSNLCFHPHCNRSTNLTSHPYHKHLFLQFVHFDGSKSILHISFYLL